MGFFFIIDKSRIYVRECAYILYNKIAVSAGPREGRCVAKTGVARDNARSAMARDLLARVVQPSAQGDPPDRAADARRGGPDLA